MEDKLDVARALREIGLLLEAKGENPFKARAYETGARALEEAPEELSELIARGRLGELRGIGDALHQKIIDLHRTGHVALLDRLRAEIPAGVVELARVPALGPRKLAALRSALGIASVEDLVAACRQGRVRAVKGFGEKSEARLLEALEAWAVRRGAPERLLLPDATERAEHALARFRSVPSLRVEIAGEVRRGIETVSEVVLVASGPRPEDAVARLRAWGDGAPAPAPASPGGEDAAPGSGPWRMVPAAGPPIELWTTLPGRRGAALLHATGPEAHLARLRALARARALRLDVHGLWPAGGREPLESEEESSIYAALGLPFVPPELRGDGGELDQALRGELPLDLVTAEDVAGLVHCHTDWSDGRATIEQMARAAEDLGAEYLTITDHSPSAAYAGGLSVERLAAQAEEIARAQERSRVRLLHGVEADILEDGALDLPDAVLESLDVVVASVHQRHRLDEAAMTRRLVRTMRLPIFKIWGHALGRLLLEREPFACRVEEVLDALASSRGAVEVNGDPKRLEADPPLLRLAVARGIPVVLSVDAHSTAALGYLRWAVVTARRAGVRRGQVLNTLPCAAFMRAVRPAGPGAPAGGA